jgi:hypothetical protein
MYNKIALGLQEFYDMFILDVPKILHSNILLLPVLLVVFLYRFLVTMSALLFVCGMGWAMVLPEQ